MFAQGCSGGQRKRVNIGIELVSIPLALFLDEPTSGLDSTAAYEAISSLLPLLALNMNIAAVIHQPREDIFELFDRVILLANGGATVYAGKRELLIPYFEKLGYTFHQDTNPADEVLDIICGKTPPPDESLDLTELWEEFSKREKRAEKKPVFEEDRSFQTLDQILRHKRAILAEEDVEIHDEMDTPMQDIISHKESKKNDLIKGLIACAINVLGCVVCIVLMTVDFTQNLLYLWVIIPFCSVALALYIGTIAFTLIMMRNSRSEKDLMEKVCLFSSGTVFGPLAIIACLVWQNRRRSRFYLYWLYVCAGFAIWTLLLSVAFGMGLALKETEFSGGWAFTENVAIAWTLFVVAPFAFVVLMASIIRIFRHSKSSVREIAPLITQIALQFHRCALEQWRRPGGLLLDLCMPAVGINFTFSIIVFFALLTHLIFRNS